MFWANSTLVSLQHQLPRGQHLLGSWQKTPGATLPYHKPPQQHSFLHPVGTNLGSVCCITVTAAILESRPWQATRATTACFHQSLFFEYNSQTLWHDLSAITKRHAASICRIVMKTCFHFCARQKVFINTRLGLGCLLNIFERFYIAFCGIGICFSRPLFLSSLFG